jgi:hypothetical protein
MRKFANLILSISVIFISSCAQIPSLFVGSRMEGYQDGTGENVKFGHSLSMAIDKDGNLFVGDNSNHRIRKVTPEGKVTTFAGTGEKDSRDGDLKTASFEYISDLKFDSKGNLFVADKNILKKITPEGSVTTFAGNGKEVIKDGVGTEASFGSITSIFIDKKDDIYLIDSGHSIKIISADSKVKSYDLQPKMPIYIYMSLNKILLDKNSNIYLVIRKDLDWDEAGYIYKINSNEKAKKILDAGSNINSVPFPNLIINDDNGNIYILDSYKKSIFRMNSDGKEIKEIAKFKTWFPVYQDSFIKSGGSMVIDNKLNVLYVSDFETASIYKVKLEGDK